MFSGGEEIKPTRHLVLSQEELTVLAPIHESRTDEREEKVTSVEIDPGKIPNDGKVDIYVCYADPSKIKCACDVYSTQFAKPSLAIDFLPCNEKGEGDPKIIPTSLFESVIEVLERYDVPIPPPSPAPEPIPTDQGEEPAEQVVQLE